MSTRKKSSKDSNEVPVFSETEFFKALELLGAENSVETEVLIEKVKSAMLKAARTAYPHSEERIRVEIDPAETRFKM